MIKIYKSAFLLLVLFFQNFLFGCRAGRYEVDGYIYNAAEEPKILITGKWNESLSYQPCDLEGEPTPGTELKEVTYLIGLSSLKVFFLIYLFKCGGCWLRKVENYKMGKIYIIQYAAFQMAVGTFG